MYAIIEAGGKQYRVTAGDVIEIERTPPSESGELSLDRVLLVGGEDGVKVGSPFLENASVRASAVAEVRGPKLRVFKKKRRKGYKRLRGHRQDLLRLRVDEIVPG